MHTTLHVEAALCIWEALIDTRAQTDHALALGSTVSSAREQILECFAQRGTNEMRHAAMALGALCSDLWQKLPENERPDCFDWDYVPAFVDMLTWDAKASGIVTVPSVEEALGMYRAFWAAHDVEVKS